MGEPNDQPKTKQKRRWLRYSMRGMLLLVTLSGIWLGVLVKRANDQRKSVDAVKELGGSILYDFQMTGDSMYDYDKDAELPGPDLLRDLIGIDYFADVVGVDLDKTSTDDLAPLSALGSLKFLSLDGTSVSDLTPLSGLGDLQKLWVAETSVSDLTPLSGMRELQELYLGDTLVSDLTPLAGLNNLRMLYLDGTSLSDLASLSNLGIWKCSACATPLCRT